MECKVCGKYTTEGSKFCTHCGSRILTVEEAEEILETALNEGEEAFREELREAGVDIDNDSEIPAVREKRASAVDRLKSVGSSVKKGVERSAEMGRQVSGSTSEAIRKTKEVSADAKQKYDDAVVKGKEVSADVKQNVDKALVKGRKIGKDVSAIAKQVGDGTEAAVNKTRKSMEELGQVGVIITQRALDVVRASMVAVEIVDEYLVENDSNFEIGIFITGVAIPPYLEIEFHKRTKGLTEREKDLVEALRAAGIKPDALLDHLKTTVKPMAVEENPEKPDS